MIQKLVAASLRLATIIVVLAIALVVLGLLAYRRLDVEAYPNPVAPMVEVITQPSGLSAEEVERYVTIPLEVGLSGIVDLDHIRSQSLFGLSDVKCLFHLDAGLLHGPAARPQPPQLRQPPGQPHAPAVALECHRGAVPLPAEGTGLLARGA